MGGCSSEKTVAGTSPLYTLFCYTYRLTAQLLGHESHTDVRSDLVGEFCLLNRVGPARRVGMLFLPDDDKLEAEARSIIEDVVAAEGRCRIAGWRDVPVVKEVVGPLARANEPRVVQVRRAVQLGGLQWDRWRS